MLLCTLGEVAGVQQEQQPAQEELQHQQEPQQLQESQQVVEQPSTPSSVKRDGLGYALPSRSNVVKIVEPKQDKGESYYASVNMTQKRLSQRKKQAIAKAKAEVAIVSGEPPPLPPAIDPALVDDDIKTCPLTPPRLPESDELVEPESSEPPYARVNKLASTSDLPPNKENIDNDDVDPYATVDIAVTGRQRTVGLTMDREYDSIDNVMSPQEPFNVQISQIEGEYASVRSDATLHNSRATVMLQDSQGVLSASNDQTAPVNGQSHHQQTRPTPQQTTPTP